MVDSTPLLTERLCTLKVKVAEALAVHEKQMKALETDPEFGRLMDAERAAHQQYGDAQKNVEAIEGKVTLMFLKAQNVIVSYTGGKNGGTIRPEVIAAIGSHLPLSKLTTKNVEDIVNVMRNTEMARHPELLELREKATAAHAAMREADKEYYAYSRKQAPDIEMYEEQREIREIEVTLRDPAAAERAEDRERARAQIPEKIPAIYETLIAELRHKGEVEA